MSQPIRDPRHGSIPHLLATDAAIFQRLADATDARDLAALEWESLDVNAARSFDYEAARLTDSARRIYLEAQGLSPVDVYNVMMGDRAHPERRLHNAA